MVRYAVILMAALSAGPAFAQDAPAMENAETVCETLESNSVRVNLFEAFSKDGGYEIQSFTPVINGSGADVALSTLSYDRKSATPAKIEFKAGGKEISLLIGKRLLMGDKSAHDAQFIIDGKAQPAGCVIVGD